MAKYCVKCGKALPEGVEICPDCNAAAAQEKEAALFTHMSPDAEVWKAAEPVKQRRQKERKPRSARRTAFFYATAAVLVVAAAVLIIFGQPASRVARALRRGDIDGALQIYWSTPRLSESEERSETVDKAIMEAAAAICAQYADHTLDADTAATRLAQLGTFGDASARMLADTYAEFRAYSSSQGHMAEADKHFANGEYLEAREEYLLVLESDADYAAAQTKAADCLVRYGERVSAEAEALMEQNDYPGAIALLKEGNATLSEGYAAFSEDIDALLPQCYDRYEQHLLSESKSLAALGDYAAAVKLLRGAQEHFPAERESLTSALADYEDGARDKRLEEAGTRAEAEYAAGRYAAAFAILEDFAAQPDEDAEGAKQLIADLERRFAADKCAEAKEAFGGERDKLDEAIALLTEAQELRELDGISDYRAELESYLPLNLAEAEFSGKEGTVFRNTGDFTALNSRTYSKGWIWGENGAELSFALDGAYDLLECKFVDRRDDEEEVEGQFEVWCDGEKVFTSEKIVHPQVDGQSVSVEISGCKELKLVFLCDYEVSTTENGYCYHGICNPEVTKNIVES